MQRLLIASPRNLPVAVPDSTLQFTGTGDAGACTIRALCVKKLSAVHIAQGQMREVQVTHIPRAGWFDVAINALPEESQLKTDSTAVCRLDVARVVPPFGLEIRMIEMIPRKAIAITGQSSSILCRRLHNNCERDQHGGEHPPTLHGKPRPD